MNYTHGTYLTVSKDGTINFWTQDFQLLKTEISRNCEPKHFHQIISVVNITFGTMF